MNALRAFAIPLALYGVALCGLLFQLGQHPAYTYNWESYTAWHYWSFWTAPDRTVRELFALTDGLMTDSGRGPLLGMPISLAFALDGVGLTAMRWPVVLMVALAVPLTWELGRRLTSRPVALLAALLLAVSPAFVFYGRTATLVGISLVPALLTMLALVGALDASSDRTAITWLIGLQAALLLGIFAYAPVRLLWPLAVVALFGGAVGRRDRRRFLVAAGLVTLVTLPVVLVAMDWLTTGEWHPARTIVGYFQARGEQIFELGGDPARYVPYLREMPVAASDRFQLAWSLISQNTLDLVRLLADWQTAPVVTEYWNPSGQLWPWFVAPLFALGLGGLIVRALAGQSWRAALLLLLMLGLTVPLLLTTRVHVGRLVPALPLLLLTAAWGWMLACSAVARLFSALLQSVPLPALRLATMIGSGLVIVVASAILTVTGYKHLPADSQESRVAARIKDLADDAAEHGGAVLVMPSDYGLEIEGVRAAILWLALNQEYMVVDLTKPPLLPAVGDDRPPLYAVGALSRLAAGGLPNACGNLYLVVPDAAAEFRTVASSSDVRGRCRAGLQFELLPE